MHSRTLPRSTSMTKISFNFLQNESMSRYRWCFLQLDSDLRWTDFFLSVFVLISRFRFQKLPHPRSFWTRPSQGESLVRLTKSHNALWDFQYNSKLFCLSLPTHHSYIRVRLTDGAARIFCNSSLSCLSRDKSTTLEHGTTGIVRESALSGERK